MLRVFTFTKVLKSITNNFPNAEVQERLIGKKDPADYICVYRTKLDTGYSMSIVDFLESFDLLMESFPNHNYMLEAMINGDVKDYKETYLNMQEGEHIVMAIEKSSIQSIKAIYKVDDKNKVVSLHKKDDLTRDIMIPTSVDLNKLTSENAKEIYKGIPYTTSLCVKDVLLRLHESDAAAFTMSMLKQNFPICRIKTLEEIDENARQKILILLPDVKVR